MAQNVETSLKLDRHLKSPKMTILGYGSDCEVIAPLSLREQIAEEIKKVASKY